MVRKSPLSSEAAVVIGGIAAVHGPIYTGAWGNQLALIGMFHGLNMPNDQRREIADYLQDNEIQGWKAMG